MHDWLLPVCVWQLAEVRESAGALKHEGEAQVIPSLAALCQAVLNTQEALVLEQTDLDADGLDIESEMDLLLAEIEKGRAEVAKVESRVALVEQVSGRTQGHSPH